MDALMECLTEKEQETAREMAWVIWGINLDEVRKIPVGSGCDRIVFPVASSDPRAVWWWEDEKQPRLSEAPRFEQVEVVLDRWIVPWRVKAGYNAQINGLVYRIRWE